MGCTVTGHPLLNTLTADRPALHWDGCWYPYGELAERAARCAAALQERGLVPGDAVAVLAPNHVIHVDLMLACMQTGVAYAPLNTRLAGPEQQALLDRIHPRWLFCDSSHAGQVGQPACAIERIGDDENWLAPERVAAHGGIDPSQIAMLLQTGGSTGLPKAARIPLRQILTNATHTVRAWRLGPEDCVIQATPAFHAAVNVLSTPIWSAGGRVVWLPRFDPTEYLAAVERHRATVLFLVPTMYQMLAESPGFDTADLSSVRFAISGGAPCPAPLRARFAAKQVPFRQGYGLTEAGVNCFTLDQHAADQAPEAVGVPMPGTQAALRDSAGLPVPKGAVGELTLAGDHVFAGYLNQPDETRAALRDGWLWTGDLARMGDDGLWRIVGRRKEMFISGGENVYPAEVEQAIVANTPAAQCAVISIPDARWGEVGVAIITDCEWLTEQMRSALKPHLAGYKLPRHVLHCTELPTTGAGKIDKPALRRWAITALNLEETHEPAATG